MRNRSRLPVLSLLLALACGHVLLLGGCGQKGPLYLPDEEEQEQN